MARAARDRFGRFVKRRRSNPNPSNPPRTMARRAHAGGSKRLRRRYRRNPAALFTGRGGGLVSTVMGGALDALPVLGGRIAAGLVPGLIKTKDQPEGVPADSPLGMALQLAGAVAAGMVARMVVPQQARLVLAGGFSRVVEQLLVRANIPIISGALSAYPQIAELAAYPQLEAGSQVIDMYGTAAAGAAQPSYYMQ